MPATSPADLLRNDPLKVYQGIPLVGGRDDLQVYAPGVIQSAAPLYAGKPVHHGHAPQGKNKDRPRSALMGYVVEAQQHGGRLYATLAISQKHPAAAAFHDAFQHRTGAGLSHVVTGRILEGVGGKRLFESLSSVQSVDFVGEPASNLGMADRLEPVPAGGDATRVVVARGDALTLEAQGDLFVRLNNGYPVHAGTPGRPGRRIGWLTRPSLDAARTLTAELRLAPGNRLLESARRERLEIDLVLDGPTGRGGLLERVEGIRAATLPSATKHILEGKGPNAMKHQLTQEDLDLSQYPNKDRDPLDREENGKKASRRFDADGYDQDGRPATSLNSLEAAEEQGYKVDSPEAFSREIEALIAAIESSDMLDAAWKQAKVKILRGLVDQSMEIAESKSRLSASAKQRILESRRRKATRGKVSRSTTPRKASLLESLFEIRKEHLLGDRGSEQFAQSLLR